MPTITLNFNHEDHGLHGLEGSVKFASDFSVGEIDSLEIGGIGSWRNVQEDTLHLNARVVENLLNPVRKAKLNKLENFRWIGIKARTDILLSAAVREKGVEAIKEQLTTFFKGLSSKAVVEIKQEESEPGEIDEENDISGYPEE